jgi:hypothetical protein
MGGKSSRVKGGGGGALKASVGGKAKGGGGKPTEIAYETFDRSGRVTWKRKVFKTGAEAEKWGAKNSGKYGEMRFTTDF